MKYLFAAALLGAGFAAALSSPAAAQPAQLQQGQCLQQNRVDGWKVIDDQTLIVTDRSMRKFKVSLAKGCHDLKWPMRLGFSAGTGFGISCVQRNSFLIVPPNGGNFTQRCLVEDVQTYSDRTQADNR
ncbi:MAG TPA: DUF6491 family protein [Rhizomicrobium sp.]|jgi:hypothetical protein|nr:DUF6491 family protein [Rhizomicrobium sp.]